MVRFKAEHEVKAHDPERTGTGWQLAFQWGVYVNQDDGSRSHGYRFIWRQPDGKLQPARGQARLLSLSLIRELLAEAESEGWGGFDAGRIDAPDRVRRTDATRRAVQALAARGALHWNGGRPAGITGVPVRGRPVSETIIRDRR